MQKTILLLSILWGPLFLVQGQDENWAALPFGQEKVGFKSVWETDYSRAYRYKGDFMNRPILINLWYPAEDQDGQDMSYGDYFDLRSTDTLLDELSKEYVAYNMATLAYQFFGKEPNELNESENSALQTFLKQKIPVQKNALEKSARYPLIIYHQGFGASYEDNALLAQFLASHGFVVIGSSYFHNSDQDFGVMGGAQSVKDISYLINYASKLDLIDASNIALVGHSGGAQASVLAKSNTVNLIKAVVSLETTQETFGLADTRWDSYTQPALDKLSNMNGALLAFADHKAVFELFDMMTAADRYYVTLPETLNHDEYIAQGIFANQVRIQLQKSQGKNLDLLLETSHEDLLNYVKVNTYILDFLQWKLKKIEPLVHTFKEDTHLKTTKYNHPMVQKVGPGEKGPLPYLFDSNTLPSPRQVWSLARSHKIDSLLQVLGYFKRANAMAPIYDDIFAFALISQLIEENRAPDAKKLFDFYEAAAIPVSERFISLGKFSILMQRKGYAQRCFRNLLKMDVDNPEAKNELEKIKETNPQGQ